MDKNCQVCNKNFSFLNSKHKCPRCGLLVCHECYRHVHKVREPSISSSILKPLRKEKVCVVCRIDCKYQEDLRIELKCQWNTNSAFISKLPPLGDNLDELYKQAKNTAKTMPNYQLYLEDIKADLINGFISSEIFNYSFQDWISYSIQRTQRNLVFEDLQNLLLAFNCHYPEIGYSKELFMVAVALLTLMKDSAAFKFLDLLYHSMPPQYWPQENQAYDPNIKRYLKEYQVAFMLDQIQLPLLRKFFAQFSLHTIQTLYIGVLNFSCFYTILEAFLPHLTFTELERYLLILAKLNLKLYCKINLDYKWIAKDILRRTDHKAISHVKQVLDLKLDAAPLQLRTPNLSRNCSIATVQDPSPLTQTEKSCSNVSFHSQMDIFQEEGFIYNFQNEQAQQISQLNQLILLKKEELSELQEKNLKLKEQVNNNEINQQKEYQQFLALAEKLSSEMLDELKQCVTIFQ